MKPLFTENQRFNQWWLWLLLVATSATPMIILYKEYTNDTVSSNNLWALIIIFFVILLFVVLRMKTVITQENIQLTYFPFLWKTINLSDIDTMCKKRL